MISRNAFRATRKTVIARTFTSSVLLRMAMSCLFDIIVYLPWPNNQLPSSRKKNRMKNMNHKTLAAHSCIHWFLQQREWRSRSSAAVVRSKSCTR